MVHLIWQVKIPPDGAGRRRTRRTQDLRRTPPDVAAGGRRRTAPDVSAGRESGRSRTPTPDFRTQRSSSHARMLRRGVRKLAQF